MKRKSRIDIICFLFAFCLPAIVSLYAFAQMGAFPFGEKSLLVADMSSEYIDYYMQLGRLLREGGSFQRSWNMGMGLGMLGLIAFYAGSPLNLFLYLAPPESLTEAVFFLTVLKIGLCGLTFYAYANRCWKSDRAVMLALSIAYALSGYNIAYSSNLMWLDGVACLPIILLGVELLLRENRRGVFTLGLIWLFLSSYYIGYMAGVFTFLYFTARCLSLHQKWREYLEKLIHFGGCVLLAAGCCAFLLFPAFLNLRNGQAKMWNTSFSLSWMASPFQLVSKMLPGVYDSLTNSGMPNLYCTVFGVLFHFLFYFHSNIPKKEKLLWGIVELILLLSMSVYCLDLAWHVFEEPTWYPARYSFVFVFLILFLALRTFCEGVPSFLSMLVAGVILLLLFIGIRLWGIDQVEAASFWLGVFLIPAYLALCLPFFEKHIARIVLSCAFLLLICLESGFHAAATVNGVDEQLYYRTRSSYYEYRENLSEGLSFLPEGVYRAETAVMRNANGAFGLGYRSVSHYSSTTDQRLNSFLRALGYNTGTINELRYAPSTPLADGFLGIRYLLADLPPGNGWSLYAQGNVISAFENAYSFPLAFYADQIPEFSSYGNDPFLLQNRLFTSMWEDADAEPFKPLNIESYKEIGLLPKHQPGYMAWLRKENIQDSLLIWSLSNQGEKDAYAFFPTALSGRFSRVTLAVDGGEEKRVLAYRNNSLVPLGNRDSHRVELRVEGPSLRMDNVCFYSLNTDVANHLTDLATTHAMEIHVFEDTFVSGTVTAPRNGALLTTIPFDSGWKIRVDGKESSPQRFAGVFLAVPLEEGRHTIEMRYRAPGLLPGMILSICSTVLAVLWCGFRRKRK